MILHRLCLFLSQSIDFFFDLIGGFKADDVVDIFLINSSILFVPVPTSKIESTTMATFNITSRIVRQTLVSLLIASYNHFYFIESFSTKASSSIHNRGILPRPNRSNNVFISSKTELSCRSPNKDNSKRPTELKMSSIPEDQDEQQKNEQENNMIPRFAPFKKLPPFPQDKIVLGGDIVALLTYSALDHYFTDLMIRDALSSYLEPDSLTLPVWSDVSLHNAGQSLLFAITKTQEVAEIGNPTVLAATQDVLNQHYSPVLSNFGVSFILLSSCWLIAGYFTHAFSYENTVRCSTSDAILTAGKTWFLTAILMLGVCTGTNAHFLYLDQFDVNHLGLNSIDTNFIFDTFSVLVTWRYLAASFLGFFY